MDADSRLEYYNLEFISDKYGVPFVDSKNIKKDTIDTEGRYLYEKLYRDFPFEKYHM